MSKIYGFDKDSQSDVNKANRLGSEEIKRRQFWRVEGEDGHKKDKCSDIEEITWLR